MVPVPLKRRNWKGSFQASVPHNKGIAVNLLPLQIFGSSQKFFHIFDIDIHRSAFCPPFTN
jgi:hypothetical protein